MSTIAYHYKLIDVFTDRPFSGNPLAVFTDARGLSDDMMQRIARELNLSETTFVFPAVDRAHHYAVRIFTPNAELPMAGHPTLGTAFALAQENRLTNEERIVFEEKVGPISVSMLAPMTTIRLPLPIFGEHYPEPDTAAAVLSLDRLQLGYGTPVCAVSCGIPFLMIPLRSREALCSIQFRLDIWRRTVSRFSASNIMAFTLETDSEVSTAKARVFSPALGVAEDPATASACGALGAYLLRYGLMPPEPKSTFIIEQGAEIGRPSLIYILIEQPGDGIRQVRVGGQCVAIGNGSITLLP